MMTSSSCSCSDRCSCCSCDKQMNLSCRPKTGIWIMTLLDIALGLIDIFAYIIELTKRRRNKNITAEETRVFIIYGIIGIIFYAISVASSICIIFGANKKSLANCTAWLVINFLLMGVSIIIIATNAVILKMSPVKIVGWSIWWICRGCYLFIVICFIAELKNNKQTGDNNTNNDLSNSTSLSDLYVVLK